MDGPCKVRMIHHGCHLAGCMAIYIHESSWQHLLAFLVPFIMAPGKQANGNRPAQLGHLHHDFHDNLYVLLRGCKRFRLWPPELAPRMHTAGQILRIHSNGRIVYKGQVRRPVAIRIIM